MRAEDKKLKKAQGRAKKSGAKAVEAKKSSQSVAKKSVNKLANVEKNNVKSVNSVKKKPVGAKKKTVSVKLVKKVTKKIEKMTGKVSPKNHSNKAPLFMMAQLPFNTEEAVELNTPMIEIMDDQGNVAVAKSNLCELGVWDDILKKKKTFLEIGCGSGYLLEELCRNGDGFYLGFDPIASEVAKAKKRLNSYFLKRKDRMKAFAKIITVKPKKKKTGKEVRFSTQSLVTHCLLEEVSYPAASLDYIYSYHVFEHLENPLEMFAKANEWLSEGGRLIITCPNVEGALAEKDLGQWRCALSSHRWLPGVKTLTRAAERCGFLVEKCFTYGGFPSPRTAVEQAQNWVYKKTGKGDVLCMILKRNR